jgi:hypothetical protein
MPGVVCIPHGFGHHRAGTRLSVASRLAAGVSLNDITDAGRVDPLTGVAAVNALPVSLHALPEVPGDSGPPGTTSI